MYVVVIGLLPDDPGLPRLTSAYLALPRALTSPMHGHKSGNGLQNTCSNLAFLRVISRHRCPPRVNGGTDSHALNITVRGFTLQAQVSSQGEWTSS